MPATELGATVVRAVLTRSKLKGSDVDTVVMGNVIQAGNKMNPARQSAVDGGIPVDVPAMTVNQVCGSGAQAIASAAQEVMLGMLDSAIAGGMENMDMAPYLVANGRWGYRSGGENISALGRLARFFWGPIPWMIEVAVVAQFFHATTSYCFLSKRSNQIRALIFTLEQIPIKSTRHCEPTGPARSGRPDDRLHEAIQGPVP